MIKALVVDDHPTSRVFLERMLASAGYSAVVASTAQEALDVFAKESIDIWFVDWMMPGVSGVDLTRRLRALPGGDLAYVIMLTAKNTADDLAIAFEAGVDDFIAKPVGILELQARLKACVRTVSLNRSIKQRIIEVERLNSELKKLNRELEVVATTDGLTGLLTRQAGMLRLHEIWAKMASDTPLAVAVADIDHFKGINDAFGHARGDAALRHVACVLSEVVHDNGFVARLGGEEFLIVFPGASVATAERKLEAARIRVERAKCLADGHDQPLTVSIGIAGRGPESAIPEHLVRFADRAMYSAKAAGRNKVCIAPVSIDALAA